MSENNFINPVPKSLIKRTSTKTVKLIPTDLDKVISPYDGNVIDDDTISICGTEKENRIIIRHRFNGKYYYSIICNVNIDNSYKSGTTQIKIKKGEEIGKILDDKNVFFTILDDNKNETLVDSFLLSKEKDKEDRKDKEDKEDKEDKKDTENKKKPNGGTKSDSSNTTLTQDWLIGVPSELLKLGGMSLSNKPEKKDDKKEETNEELRLKENIERIKSLLK